MNKKEFKKIGVNEAYLSEILGAKVKSFDIEPVTKGPCLRSELHRFYPTYQSGKGPYNSVFVKDSREGLNNSGDIYRSEDLERNELSFLIFSKDNPQMSTPRYFGHINYEDEQKNKHSVIFMSDDGRSLEDLVIEDSPSSFEQFNLVQRSYDWLIVNGHTAVTNGYRTESVVGVPTIYKIDENFIQQIINKTLSGLITYRFGIDTEIIDEDKNSRLTKVVTTKQFKEFLRWVRTYGLKTISDKLRSATVPKLTRNPCKILIPLGLQPDDILVGENPLPKNYESEDILKLLNGEKIPERADTIKITDNCRIGEGPLAMFAFLPSHLSFDFSKEEMKELNEHALLQYSRAIREENLNLQDIDYNQRTNFDEEWSAAQLLAWLYRLDFITNFNNNNSKKAKEMAEARPLYEPRSFINSCIDRLISLETPHFEDVHAGFRELKINGA